MHLYEHGGHTTFLKKDPSARVSQKREASTRCSTPTFLEFFAGSGLVAEGLRNHFRAVWANDQCPKKAAVYTANHGSEGFHLGSIADVEGSQLPACPLAWASFPCQDLSLAGPAGGIHARRSGLVWEWLRVLDEMPISPAVLVAENVAGLVSAAEGRHYRALHEALLSRGYVIGAMLIDAVHWVPQSRPRIFVVAAHSKLVIPAHLVDSGPNWLHRDAVCRAAAGLTGWVFWKLPEPLPLQKRLSDLIEWNAPFSDTQTNAHNIGLLSRKHRALLEQLPPHDRFVAPGYKRTRQGKQVLELRFDDLSGCLRTPEGGSSRQTLVIKTKDGLQSRLITIREAARLMGAPDSYRFLGSYNDQYKALGDAVAVPVSQWLAEHLLSPLVQSHKIRTKCS
jgi:DNA (cytosine-5)-methyltransferase 1